VEIKIRELKVKDYKRVAQMLNNAAAALDDKTIKNVIQNVSIGSGTVDKTDRDAKIIAIFFDLFKRVMGNFADEVDAFFADLIEKTVEEYLELPISTPVVIIEQMKAAPEAADFFTGVSRTFKTTAILQGIQRGLKDAFDSITG